MNFRAAVTNALFKPPSPEYENEPWFQTMLEALKKAMLGPPHRRRPRPQGGARALVAARIAAHRAPAAITRAAPQGDRR